MKVYKSDPAHLARSRDYNPVNNPFRFDLEYQKLPKRSAERRAYIQKKLAANPRMKKTATEAKLRQRAYRNSKESMPPRSGIATKRLGSNSIRQYVLKRCGGGSCEFCGDIPSRELRKGRAFFQVAHIVGRAEGGADHPRNTIRLDPCCHALVDGAAADCEAMRAEMLKLIATIEDNMDLIT